VLARDASPAVVGRVDHKRASAKAEAHTATKAGDLRLRANRPALPVCSETQKNSEHDRKLWTEKVFARAPDTMMAHESRLQKQFH